MREKSCKASREMSVERANSNEHECVKLPDVEGFVMSCREQAPPKDTHSPFCKPASSRQNTQLARFSLWALKGTAPP